MIEMLEMLELLLRMIFFCFKIIGNLGLRVELDIDVDGSISRRSSISANLYRQHTNKKNLAFRRSGFLWNGFLSPLELIFTFTLILCQTNDYMSQKNLDMLGMHFPDFPDFSHTNISGEPYHGTNLLHHIRFLRVFRVDQHVFGHH